VDCLVDGCRRDQMFAVSELASFYGRDRMVGAGVAPDAVLWRLWRACSGGMAGDGAW
jgi:hypothetical protein